MRKNEILSLSNLIFIPTVLDPRVVEIWAPCPGFEKTYAVSSYGRCIRTKKAPGCSVGKVLKPLPCGSGYRGVHLRNSAEEKFKFCRLHILILSAFVKCDNTSGELEVNHKDFNKENNRLDNLEWFSKKENAQHALLGGRMKPRKGEENKMSKLTEDQIKDIMVCKEPSRRIALKYRVDHSTIVRIKSRKAWKHIKE